MTQEPSEERPPTSPGSLRARRPGSAAGLWVLASILLLAFGFQGSRGIWEPDEGFYSNVALGMLDSGDWLIPRLNGQPFLDKPPLLYWAVASSVGALGVDEWPARVPLALAFVGTALALGALARRWWGRRAGWIAAGMYSTSLGPFVAANLITPDTPLALFVALSAWLYCRLDEASTPRLRAGRGVLLGAAVGLGMLAKGPAMLMFAAPLGVHALVRRRPRGVVLDPGAWSAALTALLVALPWYLAIVRTLPGAGAYILDNQVVGRLATDAYARNSDPLDGLMIYLPALLLGSLPWGLVGLRRRSGMPRVEGGEASSRLLLHLWLWLPLAVLLVARSRLPLYVLPLFGPIALFAARRLDRELIARPWRQRERRRRMLVGVAVWIGVLLVGKGALARIEYAGDSRRLASEMREMGVDTRHPVVTVDTRRNGLSFYGYRHLEQVTISRHPYPFFVLPEPLAEEIREIEDGEHPAVFLVKPRQHRPTVDALEQAALPFAAHPLGNGLFALDPRSRRRRADGGPRRHDRRDSDRRR